MLDYDYTFSKSIKHELPVLKHFCQNELKDVSLFRNEEQSLGLERLLKTEFSGSPSEVFSCMESLKWNSDVVLLDGYNSKTLTADLVVTVSPLRSVIRSENIIAISLIPESVLREAVTKEFSNDSRFSHSSSRFPVGSFAEEYDVFTNKNAFLLDVLRTGNNELIRRVKELVSGFPSCNSNTINLDVTPLLIEYKSSFNNGFERFVVALEQLEPYVNGRFSASALTSTVISRFIGKMSNKPNSSYSFLNEVNLEVVVAELLDCKQFEKLADVFKMPFPNLSAKCINSVLSTSIMRLERLCESKSGIKLIDKNKENIFSFFTNLTSSIEINRLDERFFSIPFLLKDFHLFPSGFCQKSIQHESGFDYHKNIHKFGFSPKSIPGFRDELETCSVESPQFLFSLITNVFCAEIESVNQKVGFRKYNELETKNTVISNLNVFLNEFPVDWNGLENFINSYSSFSPPPEMNFLKSNISYFKDTHIEFELKKRISLAPPMVPSRL